MLEKLNDVI